MFTQPPEAIVASLVFLALFFWALTELFKRNLPGVMFAAVLLGVAFFAAAQVGIGGQQVIASAVEVVTFVIGLVSSVSAAIATATGFPQALVALGLLLIAAMSWRRNGKAKK